MARCFRTSEFEASPAIAPVVMLGIQHEQQHQELIVTDLKHAWAANPLRPVYREARPESGQPPPPVWLTFPEGLAWIGHDGGGFAFDNESPRHRVFLHGFQLANRPMGRLSGAETFGHNGSNCCIAWADPDRRLVFAYLTDTLISGHRGGRHLAAVADAVLTAVPARKGR